MWRTQIGSFSAQLKADSHVLVAGLVLSLTELLTFGPVVRQVGFYLDDWIMICQLHFAPTRSFFQLGLLFADHRFKSCDSAG